MRYSESINWIESFWKFGIKLGLHRVSRLLDELENPHLKFKSIHVAGTNGKGSVCAFTASILKEAGYKTGLFTSPHLVDYTERFKINGKDMSRKKFTFYINRIKSIISSYKKNEEKPTEFEILTAIAFLYFADEKVDIAVIETGLGGRLDSTNVIEPVATAITNVELDHSDVLGKTRSMIAREKAGIIKAGVPLATSVDEGETLDIIKKKCGKMKAPLYLLQKDPFSRKAFIKKLNIPLRGEHQTKNASVAVAIADILNKKGFNITDKSIKNGIERTVWPGRFQIVRKDPYLVIDGAHNPAGAQALRKTLLGFSNGRKIILVLGILSYKDFKEIIRILAPAADLVIATKPMHKKACEPEVIAKEASKYCKNTVIAGDVKSAVRKALDISNRNDVICVCGSLYTAGEALKSNILPDKV